MPYPLPPHSLKIRNPPRRARVFRLLQYVFGGLFEAFSKQILVDMLTTSREFFRPPSQQLSRLLKS